jgi:hypothetical protein
MSRITPFDFLGGYFCSRSECAKRKAIWDACVVDIKTDADGKNAFDTQMLAATNLIGPSIHTY